MIRLYSAQMEKYYNQIYVFEPDPRNPVSPAALAGAAAYKVHFILFFLTLKLYVYIY